MSNMGGPVDGNDSIISQGIEPDEEAVKRLPFLPGQSAITQNKESYMDFLESI